MLLLFRNQCVCRAFLIFYNPQQSMSNMVVRDNIATLCNSSLDSLHRVLCSLYLFLSLSLSDLCCLLCFGIFSLCLLISLSFSLLSLYIFSLLSHSPIDLFISIVSHPLTHPLPSRPSLPPPFVLSTTFCLLS